MEPLSPPRPAKQPRVCPPAPQGPKRRPNAQQPLCDGALVPFRRAEWAPATPLVVFARDAQELPKAPMRWLAVDTDPDFLADVGPVPPTPKSSTSSGGRAPDLWDRPAQPEPQPQPEPEPPKRRSRKPAHAYYLCQAPASQLPESDCYVLCMGLSPADAEALGGQRYSYLGAIRVAWVGERAQLAGKQLCAAIAVAHLSRMVPFSLGARPKPYSRDFYGMRFTHSDLARCTAQRPLPSGTCGLFVGLFLHAWQLTQDSSHVIGGDRGSLPAFAQALDDHRVPMAQAHCLATSDPDTFAMVMGQMGWANPKEFDAVLLELEKFYAAVGAGKKPFHGFPHDWPVPLPRGREA